MSKRKCKQHEFVMRVTQEEIAYGSLDGTPTYTPVVSAECVHCHFILSQEEIEETLTEHFQLFGVQ